MRFGGIACLCRWPRGTAGRRGGYTRSGGAAELKGCQNGWIRGAVVGQGLEGSPRNNEKIAGYHSGSGWSEQFAWGEFATEQTRLTVRTMWFVAVVVAYVRTCVWGCIVFKDRDRSKCGESLRGRLY